MEKGDGQFMTNREMMREMFTKVNRLHEVVIGDLEAKRPGLVHDVNDLKEKDKNRSKIFIFVSAISSGLALGFKWIAEWINSGGNTNHH